MCVLICNKKNSRPLTREEFDQCWNRNPHGFGVMFSKNNQVVVYKSLLRDESYELYMKAMSEAEGGNVVPHFRMATHGSVSIDNCHPFHCGRDIHGGTMYLAHNGVLGYTSQTNPDWSDTKIFAHSLASFPKGYNLQQEYIDFINKQLSWDKVIIMDSRGEVFYFGAKGVDVVSGENGIWASNSAPIIYTSNYTRKSYKHTAAGLEDDDSDDEEEAYLNELNYSGYGDDWESNDFPPRNLKKKPPQSGGVPVEGTFIGIPSVHDENDAWYYYDGKLYGDDYYIDRDGCVSYYVERDD